MIKVVIIDDEIDAIKSIELIINEYCSNAEIIGTANSAIAGKKIIAETNPDLVFLDIEMPRGSGFDLLEMIPERNFEVIFITAYNNFAIKAFKYSAIDYILKPIDIEELTDAVNKAAKRILANKKSQTNNTEKYNVLLDNIKGNGPRKIMVTTSEGHIYIDVNDIIRIEAEGSYSNIFLVDQKRLMISKNLKEFETMLSDSNFFRSHHSHYINLQHVKKYVLKEGGYIEMDNDTIVPISRRRKDLFVEKMDNYIKNN